MSPDRRRKPDVDFVERVMEQFVADFPEAVLIGGWATYLRTKTAKSHDIDVIVDHATLGQRLRVPVEALIRHTERIGRAKVLAAEAQFVAKMAALLDRPDSLPGQKDREELWALVSSDEPLDFDVVAEILEGSGWDAVKRRSLLEETFGLLEETPGLRKTDRSKLRRCRRCARPRGGTGALRQT